MILQAARHTTRQTHPHPLQQRYATVIDAEWSSKPRETAVSKDSPAHTKVPKSIAWKTASSSSEESRCVAVFIGLSVGLCSIGNMATTECVKWIAKSLRVNGETLLGKVSRWYSIFLLISFGLVSLLADVNGWEEPPGNGLFGTLALAACIERA